MHIDILRLSSVADLSGGEAAARRVFRKNRGQMAAENMPMGKCFGSFKRSAVCVLWTVCFAGLATIEAMAKPCTDTRVDLRGDWGQVSFDVALADTPKKRALGLMHVEHLPRRNGMLFIYPSEAKVAFWMKNTLISLDMLFFDASGRMTGMHVNAQPHDLTPKVGGNKVKYVLEINGGLSTVYGINGRTVLRHPVLGDAGIWRCDED